MPAQHDHGERLASIEAKLDAMAEAQDERWEALERRLFGNGQPGEMSVLRNEIRENKRETDERLDALERFRWALGGALLGGASFGGAVASKALSAFLKLFR